MCELGEDIDIDLGMTEDELRDAIWEQAQYDIDGGDIYE